MTVMTVFLRTFRVRVQRVREAGVGRRLPRNLQGCRNTVISVIEGYLTPDQGVANDSIVTA